MCEAIVNYLFGLDGTLVVKDGTFFIIRQMFADSHFDNLDLKSDIFKKV